MAGTGKVESSCSTAYAVVEHNNCFLPYIASLAELAEPRACLSECTVMGSMKPPARDDPLRWSLTAFFGLTCLQEENKDQPGGERRRSKSRHFF